MSLDTLKAVAQEAITAKVKHESAIYEHKKARREAFDAELAAEVEAKFGADLRRLSKAAAAAQEAVTNEEERIALAGDNLPHPIGTVLCEWHHPGLGWTRQPLALSGKRGVVEVITAESKHPDNLSDWSMAKRGQWVVRLLKKDGTQGSRYIKGSAWEVTNRWFPEGQKPPKNAV